MGYWDIASLKLEYWDIHEEFWDIGILTMRNLQYWSVENIIKIKYWDIGPLNLGYWDIGPLKLGYLGYQDPL